MTKNIILLLGIFLYIGTSHLAATGNVLRVIKLKFFFHETLIAISRKCTGGKVGITDVRFLGNVGKRANTEEQKRKKFGNGGRIV
jgi:hypothetical protein